MPRRPVPVRRIPQGSATSTSRSTGQKGYHGVAIVSRLPFEEREREGLLRQGRRAPYRRDARGGRAARPASRSTISMFRPAATSRTRASTRNSPTSSPSSTRCATGAAATARRAAAPSWSATSTSPRWRHDVWSHKQLLDVVSHTPVECEKLVGVPGAGTGWTPCARSGPSPRSVYTWWSYRAQGMGVVQPRPPARPYLAFGRPRAASRHRDPAAHARSWERPSDHVPGDVDLDSEPDSGRRRWRASWRPSILDRHRLSRTRPRSSCPPSARDQSRSACGSLGILLEDAPEYAAADLEDVDGFPHGRPWPARSVSIEQRHLAHSVPGPTAMAAVRQPRRPARPPRSSHIAASRRSRRGEQEFAGLRRCALRAANAISRRASRSSRRNSGTLARTAMSVAQGPSA